MYDSLLPALRGSSIIEPVYFDRDEEVTKSFLDLLQAKYRSSKLDASIMARLDLAEPYFGLVMFFSSLLSSLLYSQLFIFNQGGGFDAGVGISMVSIVMARGVSLLLFSLFYSVFGRPLML